VVSDPEVGHVGAEGPAREHGAVVAEHTGEGDADGVEDVFDVVHEAGGVGGRLVPTVSRATAQGLAVSMAVSWLAARSRLLLRSSCLPSSDAPMNGLECTNISTKVAW
jgi:hypothetical protein